MKRHDLPSLNQKRRTIQLSLDIQDKLKSIHLLEDTLSNFEEHTNASIKKKESELREKYDKMTTEQKKKQVNALNECNNLIGEKKKLTAAIADKTKQKRKIQDTISSKLNAMLNDKKGKLFNLRERWKNGTESREKKMIEMKTKEIRQITIKGLEPEVKKLLLKHREKCGKIKDEKEMLINEIEMEQKSILGHEIISIHERTEAQKRNTQDETRAAWERKITDLHMEHVKNMAGLREKLLQETNDNRRAFIEENRKIADQHSFELLELQRAREARFYSLQDTWNNEKTCIKQKKIEDKDSFLVCAENNKKVVCESLIHDNRNMKHLNLEKEKKRLRSLREKKIDKVIRRTQIQMMQDQDSNNSFIDEEIKNFSHFHQKKVIESIKVKDNWCEKSRSITLKSKDLDRDYHYLQERSENLKESMNSFHRKLKIAENNLCIMVSFDNKALDEIRKKIQGQIDDIIGTITNLESHREAKTIKHKELECIFRDRVNSIQKKHQRKLESIETLVKKEVANIEADINQKLSFINEEQICLDHLKTKLIDYTINT